MLIPALLSVSLAAIAWLLSNHSYPWPAFYSDMAMAAALAVWLGALLLQGSAPWPRLACFALACAVVPVLQVSFGLIHFGGDGFIAAFYIAGFALAMVAGTMTARLPGSALGSEIWFGLLLSVSVISVWVQLDQWLSLGQFGLYAAAWAGRPAGNLAQPNQMATLLVLGFVAALALHQQRRLGAFALAMSAAWLGFGMVLTQSRSVWVELAFVFASLIALRNRAGLRLSRKAMSALALAMLALFASWLPLVDLLMLADGRSGPGGGRAEAGTRPTHWASMIDAIGRQPWFGYGWNQVAVAQSRVAGDHRPTGEFIEHSHNMLLDLLIWNGVPLGLLVIAAVGWWIWRHVRACRDAKVALPMVAVGAVLVHAMLEFPLEYAYFLLPVGFMMGGVEAVSPAGQLVAVSRRITSVLMALLVALTGAITFEYMRAEESQLVLRFESARIGTSKIVSQAPDLLLLTQLREYLRFARTEAVGGMSAIQLDWMRDVAERYAYPPVLFRYALAAGLNGRPEEASRTLIRLTKVHPKRLLPEAQANWQAMTQTHPELAVVPFPALP